MEFFRQGQQRLGKKRKLLDVHGKFVGAGAEEIAFRADVIAEIEQLEQLELLFADIVELDVELQARAVLLQVREAGLALAADGHEASGDRDVGAVGLKLCGGRAGIARQDLGHGVGGGEAARIRFLPECLDLFELLAAQFVGVLFKG